MIRHFSFTDLPIDGLKMITPFFAEDERGYFLKSYEQELFSESDIEFTVSEDFESYSVKGVVRGLHFQSLHPQDKMIRAVTGEIFDVAVDLRPNSPTLGKWCGVILSGDKRNIFLIPKGFAHGFMVLSGSAVVNYKCCGRYYKEYDTGIVWNDPDIGIDWPVVRVPGGNLIVSDRDRSLQNFREFREKPNGY